MRYRYSCTDCIAAGAQCKPCKKEYNRQYHLKHREEINARARAYAVANAEAKRVYSRNRYHENPERERAYAREHGPTYYANNLEAITIRRKTQYAILAPIITAKMRANRRANPEIKRAQEAAWRQANPEKVRAKHARRRARELALSGTFTATDIQNQYAVQQGICYYCRADLKVTNYHVDHKIPVSRGGGSNAPDNLVCACPTCNLRKGAQTDVDFFVKRLLEMVSY